MTEPIVERHCWAEIDLDALRHNFAYVQKTVGGPVCAVVKADAYGHGAVAVARALYGAGAAGFAVSCLGEARHLRRHGITLPILVLGYTDPAFAAGLANQGITQAVFSPEYARALSAAAVAAGVSVSCHLKVDTGMGRIGFAVRGNFGAAVAALCAGDKPELRILGVFSKERLPEYPVCPLWASWGITASGTVPPARWCCPRACRRKSWTSM